MDTRGCALLLCRICRRLRTAVAIPASSKSANWKGYQWKDIDKTGNKRVRTNKSQGDMMVDLHYLNIRGASNKLARVHSKELVNKFHPTFFILFETHIPFERMKSFWNSLGYQGVGIVEANGHNGGIWILCSNSNISVRVLDVVDQCISFEITMGNNSSYCSAVYANQHIHRHKELWGDLTKIANMIHRPWIVLGDFNDVLLQSEVRGGQFRLARAEQFAETLEDCGLFDMGAIGRRFTWYRKVKGGVQVAKKLDRAVFNQDQ
ncbi:uncharacterized protein LOC130980686 [Arachis stenosperma]|uniref:uncharacterized protein LOC130980686 n=1 Tax=Arachis stenosperma TaxID=217475 RepID=UPI0025AB62B1|nr:uncharacterized protein LOC130980686 [Arachis stenosperma]